MNLNIATPQFEALPEGNPSNLWVIDEKTTIRLLTLGQLRALQKDHSEYYLVDIYGNPCKVKDCDDDVRFGYVAYGVLTGELK